MNLAGCVIVSEGQTRIQTRWMVTLDADGDAVIVRKGRHAHRRDADDVVLSEVHLEAMRCPDGGSTVTTFILTNGSPLITLRHRLATPLSRVGLQVWRGSALLADYVLYHSARFQGCVALELGAGVGLAGLLLARLAHKVFLADVCNEVLENCSQNAQDNCASGQTIAVRRLNWLEPPDWLLNSTPGQPDGGGGETSGGGSDAFSWSAADRRELAECQYLLAGDVVYDDVLTAAFMQTAILLLRYCGHRRGEPPPGLLVALEKRPCFTIADLEVRCPAYDYWRTLFAAEGATGSPDAASDEFAPQFELTGRRLDIRAVPQAVEYQREEHLELWQLSLSADNRDAT